MVMSLEDQTMSSPIDDTTLRQTYKQDSADEEHEDEQSKGSNQTIITQSVEHQAGEEPQSVAAEQEPGEAAGSAMQLSRESSVDEAGDRKSMQIDDLIVTKMKEIIDGPKETVNDEQQQQQQKKSSDDSLQNQNEGMSKASAESGIQQKRTRRIHCGRHHGYHHHHHHPHHHHHNHHHPHHHHHHRQSVSETRVDVDGNQINISLQSSQQGGSHPHHHHHHHHHNRHTGQHPRNRHHNHHHHHHHHHHHQQQQLQDSTNKDDKQTTSSTQIEASGETAMPSDKKTHESTTRQANEFKSSTSTVCSSSVTQPQQQPLDKPLVEQKHCQTNPDQPDENKKSSETNIRDQQQSGDLALGADQQAEKGPATQEPYPHHHHYHHNHRCHHRHKKRLVQDTSNVEQKPQQELISSDPHRRAAYPHHHHHHHHHHQHHQLQTSKEALPGSVESQQQQQQSMVCKPHYHHHHHHRHGHRIHRHHHHHHGHHHHHHHHRHHAHNHISKQRHRQKQVGSSKTNLEDQENIKDSVESGVDKCELSLNSKLDHSHQTSKSDSDTCNDSRSRNDVEPNKLAAALDNDSMMNSNQMNLDHDDGNTNGALESKTNEQQEDEDEVVKMEMSPNSDGRQSRLVYDFEHLVDSTASDSNMITSIEVVPLTGPSKNRSSNIENNSMRNDSTEDKLNRTTRQPMQDIQQQQQQQVFTQGTSGGGDGTSQMSKRKSSSHGFSGDRETQKENHEVRENNSVEKHDKLIRQTSSNGSKKSEKGEQARGSAAGNNESSNRQQINEFSSVGSGTYRPAGQANRQVIESNVPANRRCRLCWCCCCPCSSISNRAPATQTEATKAMSEPSNSPSNKCPSLPSVSLDEIRAWGESFDRLMRCTAGRKVFQDFLRCEYSEENILFWSACEELKAERDSKNIAAKARDIYEDYISILSSKEVSLDSRVREVINNNIKKPTSNIFDEAQLQIYTLMHRDSYPRFINSSMYKKLAQLQPPSRKSSS